MKNTTDLRIAWLVPCAQYGAYWPPILDKLNERFRHLKFFTGRLWPKYNPDLPGTSVIEVIGKTKFIQQSKTETGYSRHFIKASPTIAYHLLQFKPHVIFANGFSLWTLLAILLKPIVKWRIVLVYEGSSPNVDFLDSPVRLFFRRAMVQYADTFVSNSYAGKNYLAEVLGASSRNISATPYMVPDAQALLQRVNRNQTIDLQLHSPVFLFIGQVILRKGLHLLLQACKSLEEQGYTNFTLLVVGDGPQRDELEIFSNQQDLKDRVKWLGWVAYEQLGAYFNLADVFVFPTMEDTWGMVVLEAMAFGKPVLCSQWAGAKEMIVDGENGHLFDPNNTQELTDLMRQFIDNPNLIPLMGNKSRQLVDQHNPETAAQFIFDVATNVMD
jgi:glycosyltransferase involved in cell wall biosynthesis